MGFLGGKGSLPRQYAAATAVFVALVLGIIFLFGHLISRSLSRRYLEDVLMTGKAEAQKIADEIGGSGPEPLNALEKRREVLIRTLEGLPQRELWESIEVTDSEGKVVYTSHFHSTEELPEEVASNLELSGTLSDQDVRETETSYQVPVSLGEVGEVVLNVSKGRLAKRVTRLREELLVQTVTVAVLTLATLVGAFVLVWLLIQRTWRLEAKHREAEELAALGTLAANLAHEIRNPLNSINLNLELLEEDLGAATDEARGSVRGTRSEVARLARLVSDFLTYARPGEPRLERVEVAPLLDDVVEFLRAEARSMGVHLRSSSSIVQAEIESDPSQLRQVILNLVLNAVQAVSMLGPDRRIVELDAESTDGAVALVIRDRGDGIPEGELDRVRKAFYSRRRGGTGLGLAIAERFVEAQGGRIELCNLDPEGFEARVVLPIRDGGGKMGA